MVVVLSVVDQEDSALLLQRIDQAFAGEPVHAGGLCLQVTPSLGLVCEPDRPERRHAAGEGPVAIVGTADQQDLACVVDYDHVDGRDEAVGPRCLGGVVVVDPLRAYQRILSRRGDASTPREGLL